MNLKKIIFLATSNSLFLAMANPPLNTNLILLGPPGAGKGTFAQALCTNNNYEHICIGDLLRAEVRKETELGKQIQELIAQGTLIDIKFTALLVKQKIDDIIARKKLFILDGFPRSFACLPYFKDIIASLDNNNAPLCVCIELDTESCLNRISNRYVCTQCDHVFHKDLDSISHDARCPQCSGTLSRRANDHAEVAQKRLADYHQTIAPMIASLKEKFPHIVINNTGTRDTLYESINKETDQ